MTLKYGKDIPGGLTIGQLLAMLQAVAHDKDKFCDLIEEHFYDGAWGEPQLFVNGLPRLFKNDVTGLLLAAIKATPIPGGG